MVTKFMALAFSARDCNDGERSHMLPTAHLALFSLCTNTHKKYLYCAHLTNLYRPLRIAQAEVETPHEPT